MRGGLKAEFLFFTDYARWREFVRRLKGRFVSVDQIASSVDWNFRYAFFKPTAPADDELSSFLQEVEEVRRNLEFLKRNFKPQNPHLLKVLENRLNHIVEEFKEYPFSDRRSFFRARLNFIRNSLNRCFVG